jgi:hypothetical protein
MDTGVDANRANAVSANEAAKAASNAYNDVDSRDGSGRFNKDGSFNSAVAERADAARAAARNAAAQVQQSVAEESRYNGATYSTGIAAQQALQGKALTQMNNLRTRQQVLAEANAIKQDTLNHSVNPASYRLGITQRQQVQMGSINVAASTLGNKPVNVTVNGVTQTVAASKLAPSVQVSVPYQPAFERTQMHGNDHSQGSHSSHEAGSNNGQNNAHNNAMGRADGVGGHSQFR